MNETTPRRFNQRAFVDSAMIVSLICLFASALILLSEAHDAGSEGGRSLLGPIHGSLGAAFTGFATWHVVLNRRTLWKFVTGVGRRVASAEFVCAVFAVAAAVLAILSHEFL